MFEFGNSDADKTERQDSGSVRAEEIPTIYVTRDEVHPVKKAS
jgi:hypothetical protein